MDGHDDSGPLNEQVEDRLKKIEEEVARLGGTQFEEVDEDEVLHNRLKDFESRAKIARHVAKPVISPGGVRPTTMRATRDTGVALAVAYNVLGCTIGGWAIGWVIDSTAHTRPMGQALGALIGAIAGITAAIWLALKAESMQNKD